LAIKLPEHLPAAPRIASFSRRQGRALHPNAKRLVQELLPRLQIALPQEGMIDPRTLFPPYTSRTSRDSGADAGSKTPDRSDDLLGCAISQLCLEIGFGGGEYLAAQAKAHPEWGFIGCEPFINGVAKLLAAIERDRLTNIRLFTDDARAMCDALPDASIAHIAILFPDPWPKARHHKRRLVSLQTLELLARIQPQGARLLLATDHEDYGAQMLEVLRDSPHYEWQAQARQDWQTPPEGWVNTRYELKTTAEGRHPLFLLAKRSGIP
jgi:tRNA (guanine-N7-)-methyltransferase